MKVLRAILGALCGYLIFAVTGVALGVLSGRNLHTAQPLWFVALTAGYGVLIAGLGGLGAVGTGLNLALRSNEGSWHSGQGRRHRAVRLLPGPLGRTR